MRTLLAGLISSISLMAQFGFVYNAAEVIPNQQGGSSYASSPPLPALAPGSLATVLSFGPKLNATKAAVSVRPIGAKDSIAATVVSTSGTEIRFVVPDGLPPGPAQVNYRVEGDVTRWVTVSIAPSRFALFRSAGRAATAQRVGSHGELLLVSMAEPAKPGNTVVLWGSGLGGTAAADVQVWLAGVRQKVLFAGRSPGAPGLDQINVELAPNAGLGCYVPLTVRYGEQSFSSVLSVSADGSSCAHPFGLTRDELRELEAGNPLQVELLNTDSSVTVADREHASRQETATVTLSSLSAQAVAARIAQSSQPSGCYVAVPADIFLIGVIQGPYTDPFTSAIQFNNGTTSLLLEDLQGTGVHQASLPTAEDAPVTALRAPVLTGGVWSLPQLEATTTLPAPVRIANAIPTVLRRDQDQQLSWDGTAYGAESSALVSIAGVSTTSSSGATGATVRCVAPASSGKVTVPATLLAKLPASSGTLTLQIRQTAVVPIRTLRIATRGSNGVFVLLGNHTSGETRPVELQ